MILQTSEGVPTCIIPSGGTINILIFLFSLLCPIFYSQGSYIEKLLAIYKNNIYNLLLFLTYYKNIVTCTDIFYTGIISLLNKNQNKTNPIKTYVLWGLYYICSKS